MPTHKPRIMIAMQCRGEDEADQLLFAPACWCETPGCAHYGHCVAAGGSSYEPLIRLCIGPVASGQLIPRCYSFQPTERESAPAAANHELSSPNEVSHVPH